MEMTDIQTLTREKIKLEEPGLYDVIFLNDNITTTEFVVRVLKVDKSLIIDSWHRIIAKPDSLTKVIFLFVFIQLFIFI